MMFWHSRDELKKAKDLLEALNPHGITSKVPHSAHLMGYEKSIFYPHEFGEINIFNQNSQGLVIVINLL